MKYISCMIIIYISGFLYYVYFMIPNENNYLSKFNNIISDLNKDNIGIIVLTGGSNRIIEAVHLLSIKIGEKLLITGVNKSTDIIDLAHHNSEMQANLMQDMQDKITLDYNAINTKENAIESKKWLSENMYDNAILVTSHYHMPRSIHEFKLLLPKLNIIEMPVFSTNKSKLNIRKLYFIEYNKYLITKISSIIARYMVIFNNQINRVAHD